MVFIDILIYKYKLMDPTEHKFKQVFILDDKLVVGKSIYDKNDNKINNKKYILDFIKENPSFKINKFEINIIHYNNEEDY